MSPSKSPTVLDLFSGAGGLALGFKRAGFETIAGIDNDAASLETFAWNFPNSLTICEDLSSVSSELALFFKGLKGKVDVIVGGPPCQGFSIAGKRIIDDPRNSLYRHYIETVEIIKPKYVVIENVPTIRTMGGGKVANAIIQDLEDLGYEVRVLTVNASDYGVPQNRKRAFFIAKKGSAPVVFPDPLTPVMKLTTKDAIGDLPLVEDYFENLPIPYSFKAKNAYQLKMRKGSKQLFNHWSVAHTEQTKSIITLVPDGGKLQRPP